MATAIRRPRNLADWESEGMLKRYTKLVSLTTTISRSLALLQPRVPQGVLRPFRHLLPDDGVILVWALLRLLPSSEEEEGVGGTLLTTQSSEVTCVLVLVVEISTLN